MPMTVDEAMAASNNGNKKPKPLTVPTADKQAFRKRVSTYVSGNEGREKKVYPDGEGIPTVGVGFNLTRQDARARIEATGANYNNVLSGKVGLEDHQIDALLKQDLRTAEEDARTLIPSFDTLSEDQRLGVTDMAFNLGRDRLGGFKKMLSAIEGQRWGEAQAELKNSKYWSQVGNRGQRNFDLLGSTGNSPITSVPVGDASGQLSVDEAMAKINSDKAKAVRDQVKDLNPDEEAKLSVLADMTGLPEDTIRSDPDKVEAKVLQQQQEQALERAPATAKMMGDKKFAAVAHKDVAALVSVEEAMKSLDLGQEAPRAKGVPEVVGNFLKRGGLRIKQGAQQSSAESAAHRALDTERSFGEILGEVKGRSLLPGPDDLLVATTRYARSKLTTREEAEAKAQERLQNVGESAARAAALPMSGPAGRMRDTIFDEDMSIPDVLGYIATNPIEAILFGAEVGGEFVPQIVTAGVATAVAGPGAGAITMGGLSGLTERFASPADFLGSQGIDITDPAQALAVITNPELMQQAADFGFTRGAIIGIFDTATAGVASKMIGGVVTNAVAQSLTQAGGGALGEGLAGFATTGEFNPREMIAEALGEFATAPVEIAAMGGTAFRDMRKSSTAVIRRQRIQEIHDRVMESPVTERSPAAAGAHIQEAGVTEAFVPVAALEDFADANGQTIEEVAAIFGVETQIDEAKLTGGDIRMTGQQYGEHVLTKPETFGALQDHITFGPDEMSASQAEEFNEGGMIDEFERIEEVRQTDEAHQAAMDEAAELRAADPLAPQTPQEALLEAQERINDAEAPTNPDLQPASADVSLAREELGLHQLFVTGNEAGLSPKQYETYLEAVARAADGTRKRQEKKLLDKRKKANSAEIAAQREVVAEQQRESVQSEPVYAALNHTAFSGERLDRNAAAAILPDGGGQLAQLPKIGGKAIFTAARETGGVHPDALANVYGFPDGLTMMFSMIDAQPEADAIAQRTEDQMNELHPELMEEQRQIQEAIESLHNDDISQVLAMEMNALREASGNGRISPKLIKAEANRRISAKVITDVRVDLLLSQEKKEAALAGKLLRKGDRQGAGDAKFRQLMNHEMAKQAMGALKQVERQKKFMSKFVKKGAKFPTIDADFVDTIKQLLGQYDLGPRLAAAGRKKMEEWVEAETAAGALFKMPERLWKADNQKNWQEMTLDEFENLYQGIKNIEAQGKLKKGLITQGENILFEDVRNEMLEAADILEDTGRVKRARENLAPSWRDRQLAKLATADAGLSKIEFLMQALDNLKANGIWQKAIFRPFAVAAKNQQDMYRKIGMPILESLDALPKETKKALNKVIFVPSLNRKMTRANLLMVALNSGNNSNLEKMVEGSAMDNGAPAWSKEGVMEALKILSKEEAKWVQGVWNAFKEMQPEVERIYRQENGVSPKKIRPTKVNIGGLEVEGGYFPMMYRAEAGIEQPGSALDAMKADHIREGVYSGLIVERTGYAAPVVLDLNALPRGLQQNLHYITHYEVVRDVNRLIKDPSIKEKISSKLGHEYYKATDDWLKAVATAGANEGKTNGWDDLFVFFRTNFTAAVMGLSWTTGVSQVFGLSTSIAVLGKGEGGTFSSVEGTKWMAQGMAQYIANPNKARTMAYELSQEMRDRLKNFDREVSDTLGKTGASNKGKFKTFVDWQQNTTLMTIGYAQMYSVDLPTWIGALNQGLSRGMSEADAAFHADSVLRTSQASGALKDLGALQRRRDIWRAVTMFSTFTMVLYNLQKQTFGAAGKSPKELSAVVARMTWLVLVPAMADALLRQEFPDDDSDKDPATWALLKTLGFSLSAIPVLGRGADSLMQGFSAGISPIEQIPQNIVRALESMGEAWEDGELNPEAVRHILLAAGTTLGIGGTYQLNRLLKAIENEDDANAYQYLIGYNDR